MKNMNGFFGDLFDLNGDGDIDIFESGLEFMLLNELEKEDSDCGDDALDFDDFL